MTPSARGRALVACAVVALALAGCAAQKKRTPPPEAVPPATSETPPAPAPSTPPATTPGSSGVPRAGGPIAAPWDTAAQSRESRRLHVYPEGESEISRRLLASIPEPGTSSIRGGLNGVTPPAPSPPPVRSGSSSPVPSGSCYEVQILMTLDKSRAERVRDEAEKALGVATWVISSSGGIHKVRLGGCLTMEGAAELAARVRQKGYPEAFRVAREP
jgi:hypothetical protein